jgi:hypothetical protein
MSSQKRLKHHLGLLPPKLTPFHVKMAYYSMNQPLRVVRNMRIRFHGIPYTIFFTVIDTKFVDPTYSMLLGKPWLHNVKVVQDWGKDLVTIEGNNATKTIQIPRYLNNNTH